MHFVLAIVIGAGDGDVFRWHQGCDSFARRFFLIHGELAWSLAPVRFYAEFRRAHGLTNLRIPSRRRSPFSSRNAGDSCGFAIERRKLRRSALRALPRVDDAKRHREVYGGAKQVAARASKSLCPLAENGARSRAAEVSVHAESNGQSMEEINFALNFETRLPQ